MNWSGRVSSELSDLQIMLSIPSLVHWMELPRIGMEWWRYQGCQLQITMDVDVCVLFVELPRCLFVPTLIHERLKSQRRSPHGLFS